MALVRTCVDWKALRPAPSAQARLRCLTGPGDNYHGKLTIVH